MERWGALERERDALLLERDEALGSLMPVTKQSSPTTPSAGPKDLGRVVGLNDLAGIGHAIIAAQPWASITVEGPRHLHNLSARPASTIIGKRVVIYAAAKPDLETGGQAMELLASLGPTKAKTWNTRKVLGAAIGVAVVTGIVSEHDSPWFVGPFALVLSERAALKAPVPVRLRGAAPGMIWRIG